VDADGGGDSGSVGLWEKRPKQADHKTGKRVLARWRGKELTLRKGKRSDRQRNFVGKNSLGFKSSSYEGEKGERGGRACGGKGRRRSRKRGQGGKFPEKEKTQGTRRVIARGRWGRAVTGFLGREKKEIAGG